VAVSVEFVARMVAMGVAVDGAYVIWSLHADVAVLTGGVAERLGGWSVIGTEVRIIKCLTAISVLIMGCLTLVVQLVALFDFFVDI